MSHKISIIVRRLNAAIDNQEEQRKLFGSAIPATALNAYTRGLRRALAIVEETETETETETESFQ